MVKMRLSFSFRKAWQDYRLGVEPFGFRALNEPGNSARRQGHWPRWMQYGVLQSQHLMTFDMLDQVKVAPRSRR